MITVNEIELTKAVAQSAGMEYDNLIKGEKRVTGDTWDVQIIAIAILRHEHNVENIKVCKLTHQQICLMFNKRRHSNSCYAVDCFRNLMDTNKYFRAKCQIISERVEKILTPTPVEDAENTDQSSDSHGV